MAEPEILIEFDADGQPTIRDPLTGQAWTGITEWRVQQPSAFAPVEVEITCGPDAEPPCVPGHYVFRDAQVQLRAAGARFQFTSNLRGDPAMATHMREMMDSVRSIPQPPEEV
jgi:hypothetical protein